MPPCSNFKIWNPVPAGTRFCASVSGTANDFSAGIRLIGDDGSETTFLRDDLLPGPAHRTLTQQGYAVRIAIAAGPTGPTVTLNAWLENVATGARLTDFDCTWTTNTPGKVRRITVGIVPETTAAPADAEGGTQ